MARTIWVKAGILSLLAIAVSAIFAAPLVGSLRGGSPTVTVLSVSTSLVCVSTPTGLEGQITVSWAFMVVSDSDAAAGLTLVVLSFQSYIYDDTEAIVGWTTWDVYRSRPSPSTSDMATGSYAFSDLTLNAPHSVWIVLRASDSTGITTERTRIDLPDCFNN